MYTIFIPSSQPKNYLWGTSFHIDHLYSSSLIQITHDGYYTRIEKIKNIIAKQATKINLKRCIAYKKQDSKNRA